MNLSSYTSGLLSNFNDDRIIRNVESMIIRSLNPNQFVYSQTQRIKPSLKGVSD